MSSSANYETYVPVYNFIPEEWEEARIILIEYLRMISNGINNREVGFLVNDEILAGKFFYPSTPTADDVNNPPQFRPVFRSVIIAGPITAGTNTIAHGLTINDNFTAVDLWASASNSSTNVGTSINGTGNRLAGRPGLDIDYDATNINILSNGTYDRTNIYFEYIYEP